MQRCPAAEAWGVDFDVTLLALAQNRLAKFGKRAKFVQSDLRKKCWTDIFDEPFDAIVSATALHWFSPAQLSRLYRQFAQILKPGGIFLNADHAGSDCSQIQKEWEIQSAKKKYKKKTVDDWDGFWRAYGKALKINIGKFRKQLMGKWVGTENGLPLQWHFEKLKEAGFGAIDCFWRLDYDAIYGGIRK